MSLQFKSSSFDQSLNLPTIHSVVWIFKLFFCWKVKKGSDLTVLMGYRGESIHMYVNDSKTELIIESESRSILSNSLPLYGLYSPWNSSGQNTGMRSRSLLQGMFPTQGSNSGLPHCRQILDRLNHQGENTTTLGKYFLMLSSASSLQMFKLLYFPQSCFEFVL